MILPSILKLREKLGKAVKQARLGNQSKEKPFIEHLEDLRRTLLKMLGVLILCLIISLSFCSYIFDALRLPLKQSGIPESQIQQLSLIILKPTSPIIITFKLALYSGIIISLPLQLYFLATFIFPGLRKKEKKIINKAIFFGLFLFLAGAAFCYFIALPLTIKFLFFYPEKFGMKPAWTAEAYFSFSSWLTICFGLCFELPIIVLILVQLEILHYQKMCDTRSIAWIIILILSALLTPTTDVLTLMLLSAPLILLYEICIWLAKFIEKKRARNIKN